MRNYMEPSCRHLLRQPLVYGVPFVGILILCAFTILFQSLIFLFAGGDLLKSALGIIISVICFGVMRLITKHAKVGWDQSILFWIERASSSSKGPHGKIEEI